MVSPPKPAGQLEKPACGGGARTTEFFESWSIGALEPLLYLRSHIHNSPSLAGQWVRVVDAFVFRPMACFIPAQGNAQKRLAAGQAPAIQNVISPWEGERPREP